LEEILIRNCFDFKLTAKEFQRYLNVIEDGDNFYILDGKNLQLKWTDIEIRRHVLPKMKEEEVVENFEDDDLPPLNYEDNQEETKDEETQATKSQESDKESDKEETPVAVESKPEVKPISANIVKYDSSSDDEAKPVK